MYGSGFGYSAHAKQLSSSVTAPSSPIHPLSSNNMADALAPVKLLLMVAHTKKGLYLSPTQQLQHIVGVAHPRNLLNRNGNDQGAAAARQCRFGETLLVVTILHRHIPSSTRAQTTGVLRPRPWLGMEAKGQLIRS